MTGTPSRALVGYYRELRHLGPRDDQPHTWLRPWRYLSVEEVRRLEADTGGYYVAYCGAVAVEPRRHPGQRSVPWGEWELCSTCLTRSDLAL